MAMLTPGVLAGLFCLADPIAALAQDAAAKDLPAIVVVDPAKKPKREPAKRIAPARTVSNRGTGRNERPAQEAPVTGAGATTPAQAALDRKMQGFDQSRDHIMTKLGASTYTIDRTAIESMPQADNTPVDKLVLQLPGVSYDSAASNPNFHVRNEYANVQTRINGLVLPEGVSGLGPVIDTNFIGSLSLLTGTLPAQYGLRTAGILDITSRAFSTPGGSVSFYGGSNSTLTSSFDYGGSVDNTQYFFSGRGNLNNLGIENPTPSINAIHDQTDQGKFFAYVSTLLNETTRLSVISGASYSTFQIPNNPGQPLANNLGPPSLTDSSTLNENEIDQYYYNIVALQTKGDQVDTQFSVFSRYAQVHFIPDVTGDLAFNNVAADVSTRIRTDLAWQISPRCSNMRSPSLEKGGLFSTATTMRAPGWSAAAWAAASRVIRNDGGSASRAASAVSLNACSISLAPMPAVMPWCPTSWILSKSGRKLSDGFRQLWD
jgi:hypothetical protein